jgi:hypothetical protein
MNAGVVNMFYVGRVVAKRARGTMKTKEVTGEITSD